MLEYKKVIDKHDFIIKVDKECLVNKVNELRDDFEENCFNRFYESIDGQDKYLTKDEYMQNIDNTLVKIDEYSETEFLNNVITNAMKKKDGTLHKRKRYEDYIVDNMRFFTDWHNSWAGYTLVFKVISDFAIELQLVEETHTPG